MSQTHAHHLCTKISDCSDRPVGLDWLSPAEYPELARCRHESRRSAWLGGRWLSKVLIGEHFPQHRARPSLISIRSIDEQVRPVRPAVSVNDHPQPWSLSITHSDRMVLVALSATATTLVGVDLCQYRALSSSFVDTWFTPRERKGWENLETEQVCRSWAAKESIYKACNRGEPFTPRRIEVFWDADTCVCRYDDYEFGEELTIQSWTVDDHAAVMVTLRRK